MLRAMKKISKVITRWCFNVKKSGNRRRMVIVVALIGVYYLGKHSSSLNLGGSEGEKRYIRHPLRNRNRIGLVVEPPKQVKNNKGYVYFGDLLDPDNKMLQKERNNGDTELNKIKMVTPSATAEQIKQHVKASQGTQNKAISQHRDDDHIPQNAKADTTISHPVKSTTSSTSTGNHHTDKTYLVQADEPKSMVMTDKRTPTAKPTVPQTMSTEGSTIHNNEANTNATPVHSEHVDKVDLHLRDLVNDKKLFGFVDKNDTTDQLQHVNILRTHSYTNILKYQMTRKTKSLSRSGDDFLNKYGYSKETSDDQPLLRNVPDNRDPRCKGEEYGANKLDISVVSVVQNSESVSVILRMLVSLLHRTPQHVLNEIILVIDAVIWDKEESNLLHSFVTNLPKVNIISHNISLGLAQCMNIAAKMANGQVLAFLSPKIEVTNDWHIALLAWLAENPNDMVLPVIDPVHWKTLEFSKSKTPVQIRGGFTWGLMFRWKAIPDEEKQRRRNNPIELRTPMYHGGIILVNSVHYNTLLGANEAIEGYDNVAVAMELSLKQWMCGGMILTIPCSRVGYIYALESPILTPPLVRNRVVIAESLMDDYKRHFYKARSLANHSATEMVRKVDASIYATKTLKQKLNCNSFEWYMYNVCYDKKEPRADSQYAGLIRGAGMCVDASSYTIGRSAACKACYNESMTQQFEMDISGTLIFDEDFILGQRKPNPSSGSPVEVLKRRTMFKTQQWEYDPETTRLLHTTSGLCMTCVNEMLTLSTCDNDNRRTQGWKFDWKSPS